MNILNISRWVAGVIMLQTLFFKFTAAPESVYIFSTVGIEPWGRIGTGMLELVAAALLFYRPTAWLGAGLGLGLMLGAIATHFVFIGIEVQGDHGKLFGLAIVTLICCILVLYKEKARIAAFVNSILK